jgi:hypothetical protein
MKKRSPIRRLICIFILIIAAAASAQDIEYVNSMYWSGVYDVQVRDMYAYYCFSPGLVIIDISNIEEPLFVSRLYIPGDNRNIVVSDNYAFVFGNRDRLRIIDIANPENPQFVSDVAIDAEVDNVWVEGNYVYAAAGLMGMLIIDVSDPSAPEIITEYPTSSDIESIVVIDTLAFIAGRFIYPSSESFQIINVADVYNPVLIGYIDENIGWNHDLIVDGDYAYLANSYEGFIIVDISSLSDPQILTQLEDITHPRVLGKVDDYLFMDFGFDTLQVFEVSAPTSPEQVGFHEIGRSAMDFDISDGYLFIAGNDLPILDVVDVENIRQVSEYEVPSATSSVFKVGDFLYTAETGFGLHIHDITDPAYPDRISQLELPEYFYAFHLSENYLYSLSGNELGIIDISDPSSPGEIFFHTFERDFVDVFVNEPYIYLTTFSWGVSVYQRISQDSLEFIRDFNCYEYAFDVEIENNIGYFSQCFALNIYDLTNPEDSVLLSSILPVSGAGQLYFHDDFIYTQLVDGGCNMSISIIDVRDPSNPEEIDLLYFPSYISDVHFDDNLAYFSVYRNELYVYDVSDPYNPVLVTSYNTPGYIRNALSHGNYVFVADNTSLVILRYALTGTAQSREVPINFSLSANHPNPFNAFTIIRYTLPSASDVTIDIYDILGRRVETLVQEEKAAGYHQVVWDASDRSSGIYFFKIEAGELVETRKMVLLK